MCTCTYTHAYIHTCTHTHTHTHTHTQTKALQDSVTALGQQLADARAAASGDAAEVVEATRFRDVEASLKEALIDLDQAKEVRGFKKSGAFVIRRPRVM